MTTSTERKARLTERDLQNLRGAMTRASKKLTSHGGERRNRGPKPVTLAPVSIQRRKIDDER